MPIRTTKWPEFRAGDDWRERNRLRKQQIHNVWAEWLARINWEAFVTLTFDPNKTRSVSRERVSREAFRWCNDVSRVTRSPIGWVYAPERGEQGGLWHAHVLVVGAPPEVLRGVPAALWVARNGFVKVQQIDSVARATFYTTKSAALTGELVWSDTLSNYRQPLALNEIVLLHP